MIRQTPSGLYCEHGNFYIDPSHRVEHAVITHAHADHARKGMGGYLAHVDCIPLLKHRLGKSIITQAVKYGERTQIGNATVSLHPSGHILGSAQIRIEVGGEVWVVTGDYKREKDKLSTEFEVVPCNTLVTECTFGLPVYKWPNPAFVAQQINEWWRANADVGVISVIHAYSLGKAQRILLELDTTIGQIYGSEHVCATNAVIRDHGYDLPPTPMLTRTLVLEHLRTNNRVKGAFDFRKSLVITSGSVSGILAGIPYVSAETSGWYIVKRFRRGHGFVVSDHADWNGLLNTVEDTQCERILTMHGFTEPFAKYLREQGYQAESFQQNDVLGRGLEVNAITHSDDWLTQLCIQHVGSKEETNVLVNSADVMVSTLNTPKPPTTPSNTLPHIEDEKTITITVNCVLLHVHFMQGLRTIEMLTMGVRKGNGFVPLADVGADINEELHTQILSWVHANTTAQTMKIYTVAPRFVFTIIVGGLKPARRRKVGVRCNTAYISAFIGTDIGSVTTVNEVLALIQ